MTASTTPPINVIDLFAGCGGFTAGFSAFRPDGIDSAVFKSIAAVEFNAAAATTYASNFARDKPRDHVFPVDIENWRPAELGLTGKAEVILGGPPCQGFSSLGKQDSDDPRNKLWRQYMRAVNEVKPKVFIIENVDRFLRSSEFTALQEATESPGGELHEYRLTAELLNAADYGVPQRRRRAIVIATHRDLKPIEHPLPTHRRSVAVAGAELFESDLPPWVSVDSVFARTSAATNGIELPVRTSNPLELTEGFPKAQEGFSGPYRTYELHVGRNPTALSLARYAEIPDNGNRHALRDKWAIVDGKRTYLSTESWDQHNNGSGDVMGRMQSHLPSVTIRTEFYKPEKGRYLHPTANRPISHLEAALIQGFPEDFLWCGTKVDIARQIGNAVPVGLARAIAGRVYEALRSDAS